MNILEKIEKKLPFLNFQNLNIYMVVIMGLGLLINVVNPGYYSWYLSLNVPMVFSGQIWRLFTFIFYPPSMSNSLILSLLMLYVYYSIAKTLVYMWGNFKFNLYIIIGYLSNILAGFLIYFILKQNIILVPIYNTFSIIMAFALSFPDASFLIYFLIPIKAKYFAYFEIIVYAFNFIFSDMANRIAILCSALNVIIFFVLLRKEN